jgi:NAD(P) transhydrogenase subunit alpha
MKIAVPKERRPGELRVAATPETVKKLIALGAEVAVEAGAGAGSSIPDAAYRDAGASLASDRNSLLAGADIVLKVQRPMTAAEGTDEIAGMKPGAILIGVLAPFANREQVADYAKRNVTALAMEMVPRITRAQAMDVLSSQSNLSGYRAVIDGAHEFGRIFPMLMTAAGTVPAAKVVIMGAGVAGLQAIATAKRLGAVVEAFDTRPVVKEQVESLGAKFISLPVSKDEAEGAGGYAKALSEEQHQKELDLIAGRLSRTDIVITTAQIPGRKSPILITEAMLRQMKPGSIVVDLAAEGGGNCELTVPGQTVVKHGVTLIGTLNLPALMPTHASQLYSKNVSNLVLHLLGKTGYKIDLADPITGAIVLTHEGQVVHPALKGA